MHLDGARVWNASVFLNTSMKEYCKDFNTVAVCMSKGMGSPIGSLLVGSHKDIARAKTLRKIAGGSMRQTGILAACCLVSLEDWQEKLTVDNENAKWLANEIASLPLTECDPSFAETNIVRFTLQKSAFKKAGVKDYRTFVKKLREESNILCGSGFFGDYIRFVTHRDVSRTDMEFVVKTMKTMLQ